MTIDLHKGIADYFAADRASDARAISETFTQDAVVVDEGNTYAGRDAIRQWAANASTQYTYVVEPFALSEEDGRTVVASHLVGDFPGGPVDLSYFFVLQDGKIAELEIAP